MSLTSTFVVKFQQYDNYGITSDGFAFDDISVTGSTGVPPVAAFNGTPTSGDYPLTVDFTDASTENPTSWSWTFGDGGTSTAQNPSHTYTAAGTYTVSLTVSNAFGSDTETKTNYITVGGTPPVAQFTAFPLSGDAPLLVLFTDLSTGAVSSWDWNFGDGGSSPAQDPSYAYNTPGTYSVDLTVSGSAGSDNIVKTNYITAFEPAPVVDFIGSPLSGTEPLLEFVK